MRYVTANGATLPALGFGTFRMSGADTRRMVEYVLRRGYRHIDTAQIYGNEAEVGDAMVAAEVERDTIFLTTKVWVKNYRRASFFASVDESLSKLKTDYVDLLLLHWPNEDVPLDEQLANLNEVREIGKARHIGVSNFNTSLMSEAIRLSAAPLVTNQIEVHPFLDQTKVIDAARDAGLSVTAYCPMADGKVFADTVLQGVAARHGKSVAQIVLRWLVEQPQLVALSKTVRESRADENLAIFDFELDTGDRAAIGALAAETLRLVSPEGLAPVWD